MSESASPGLGLLGFWMLLQLVAFVALLLGGLYLLYCLGRAASGLDRLATAVEEMVQRQAPPPPLLGPRPGAMPSSGMVSPSGMVPPGTVPPSGMVPSGTPPPLIPQPFVPGTTTPAAGPSPAGMPPVEAAAPPPAVGQPPTMGQPPTVGQPPAAGDGGGIMGDR